MSGGALNYFHESVQQMADNPALSTTVERKAFSQHLRKVAAALRAIEWNESGDGDDNESYLIRACLSKCDVLYAAIEEAEEILVTLEEEVVRAKIMHADVERAMYHVSPELAGQPCTIKYRIPAQGSQGPRACIRLDGGLGDIFVPEHCLKPITENE